jgi:hypothetical protein
MNRPSRGGGRKWGAALLAVVGLASILVGILYSSFRCFMITDPACRDEAVGGAVAFALAGMALIALAVGLVVVGRRGS